jgi:hypothetical protein
MKSVRERGRLREVAILAVLAGGMFNRKQVKMLHMDLII